MKLTEKIYSTIVELGKKMDKNFKIDKYNKSFYENFIKYHIRDKSCEYDLNKGILLLGPHGSGKTFAFKLLQNYLTILYRTHRHFENFKIITATDLQMCAKNGTTEEGFTMYDLNIKEDYHVVVDELGGNMAIMNNFGTKIEPQSDFLRSRYNLFIETRADAKEFKASKDLGGMRRRTHCISNFTTKDLKGLFDSFLIDRFNEMFNVVYLEGPSRRD